MPILHILKTCDTPEARARGLQGTEISGGECCLFLFDANAPHAFWGLNTPQKLWVNFVEDGYVVESLPINPYDTHPVKSIGNYTIAFESLGRWLGREVEIDGDEMVVF